YTLRNLQESLELTDDQFVKVLPLVKRLQTDRRAAIQRRQQALMELRRPLASGEADEPRGAGGPAHGKERGSGGADGAAPGSGRDRRRAQSRSAGEVPGARGRGRAQDPRAHGANP